MASEDIKVKVETLTLTDHDRGRVGTGSTKSKCFVCDLEFEDLDVKKNKDDLLKHALEVHKLVIADVQLVPYFHKYVAYWRDKFASSSMEEYCWGIQTNPKSERAFHGAPGSFYLLCDMLPEDKDLRHTLQRQKLNDVLEQHQREKDDQSFSAVCLFCAENFTIRYKLFHHLTHIHNFHVGRPENLVFTDELLEILRMQLERNICLYCEKDFKERVVLREHMRKKMHKRINPQNKAYDKFYLINYLEMGKNWETLHTAEDDAENEDGAVNDDWSDWEESTSGDIVVCLFCEQRSDDTNDIINHMANKHSFDLDALKEELNFYQRVKLINYVREQVYQKKCVKCKDEFKDEASLTKHMTATGHMGQLPEQQDWDQPQYYFPKYEDDLLLCALDDDNDGEDDGDAPDLITNEDMPKVAKDSLLNDSNVVDDLRGGAF